MSITNHNIVLDIDATLLHTQDETYDLEEMNIYSNPTRFRLRNKVYHMNLIDVTNEPGKGNITSLTGIYRPFLKEFLDFCFEYFNNVIIWSAGKQKYVEECCRLMFPIDSPSIIYSWDDCVNNSKGLFKPLSKIYQNKAYASLNITEENTFHLDDRDDVYSLNPGNGVKIPEFECSMKTKDIMNHKDDELLKFMCWLSQDKVKNSKDIRTLDKSSIFKTSCEEYELLLEKEATE